MYSAIAVDCACRRSEAHNSTKEIVKGIHILLFWDWSAHCVHGFRWLTRAHWLASFALNSHLDFQLLDSRPDELLLTVIKRSFGKICLSNASVIWFIGCVPLFKEDGLDATDDGIFSEATLVDATCHNYAILQMFFLLRLP